MYWVKRFGTLTILLAVLGSPIFAKDYYEVPGDFPTIQQAIDASGQYGRILLSAGTFTEQLTISNKVIELVGMGFKDTTLACPTTLQKSFTITKPIRAMIGITNGGGLTLKNVTLDGLGLGSLNPLFAGIAMWNGSGFIQYCKIINVTDTPITDTPHGVGIYVFNNDGKDRLVEVKNCIISGYQKGGMAFNGENTEAHVSACIVTGYGFTKTIAQNGIQFAFGARGWIENCKVHQNVYGCPAQSACGILLYRAQAVDIGNCPLITNNQTGVCYYCTSGTFLNSNVLDDENAQGILEDYAGLSISGMGPGGHLISYMPFGDGTWGGGFFQDRVTVANANFMADQSGLGSGVRIYSPEYHTVEVDFINCLFMKWKRGMEIFSSPTTQPEVRLYNCRVTESLDYGIFNGAETTVAAHYNQWGHPSGPYHPVLNPCGFGDPVSDGVDFIPWFTGNESLTASSYLLGAATGGEIQMTLKAGAQNASREYLLLAGVTGVQPGTPLPGGMGVLPLNWDGFTNLVITLINTPYFSNFYGKLDSNGKGTAKFMCTPIPETFAGARIDFAFLLLNPANFASNPVELLIMP